MPNALRHGRVKIQHKTRVIQNMCGGAFSTARRLLREISNDELKHCIETTLVTSPDPDFQLEKVRSIIRSDLAELSVEA